MPKTGITKANTNFKLPRYLRLAKGAMWLDDISGVKLYAVTSVFVGRGKKSGENSIPLDKFNNNNLVEYGYVDKEFTDSPWYVDVSTIPPEKQSRLILAFKHGILVEADPKNPPKLPKDKTKQAKDFEMNKKGDLVFVGKNKDIFTRLQNLSISKLREFIALCPKTEAGKNNLMDMYHYEVRGYNKLARPRLEVLDLIRNKLKEFGPTMSAIRVNE